MFTQKMKLYLLVGLLGLALSCVQSVRSQNDRAPDMELGFYWKEGRHPDTLKPQGDLVQTVDGRILAIYQYATVAKAKRAAILSGEAVASVYHSKSRFVHYNQIPSGIPGYIVKVRKPL